MGKLKVKPYGKKVSRLAMYSTSRDGETLEEFKHRTETKSSIVINGAKLKPSGEYDRKYIPSCQEVRWVTKFLEESYA